MQRWNYVVYEYCCHYQWGVELVFRVIWKKNISNQIKINQHSLMKCEKSYVKYTSHVIKTHMHIYVHIHIHAVYHYHWYHLKSFVTFVTYFIAVLFINPFQFHLTDRNTKRWNNLSMNKLLFNSFKMVWQSLYSLFNHQLAETFITIFMTPVITFHIRFFLSFLPFSLHMQF